MNWLIKILGFPKNIAVSNAKGEIISIRKKSISSIKMYQSTVLKKTWYVIISIQDTQVFEIQFDNEKDAMDKLAELEALVF